MHIRAIFGGLMMGLAVALAVATPAARAAGPAVPADPVAARLVPRGRVGRAGRDAVGRSPSRYRAGLAHLLAQPRRFRPADRDRLDAPGRVQRRRDRLAGAGTLRPRHDRQLRISRIGRPPGADRRAGEPRPRRQRAPRSERQLAGMLGHLHPGRGQAGARPAGRRHSPGWRSLGCGIVRRGARFPAAAGRVRDPLRRLRARGQAVRSSRGARRHRETGRIVFPVRLQHRRCRGRAERGAPRGRSRAGAGAGERPRGNSPGDARRRLGGARRRRRAGLFDRRAARGCDSGRGKRARNLVVAGAVAGAGRRHRAQPDAVRLPGAVPEGARRRPGGPPRRSVAPRDRLRRRRHPQLCAARRRPLDAARRRRRDRLGLPIAIAGGGRAPRLPVVCDGAEPLGGRRVRRRALGHRQPPGRRHRARRGLCHRHPGDDRRDPLAPRPLWVPRSALR